MNIEKHKDKKIAEHITPTKSFGGDDGYMSYRVKLVRIRSNHDFLKAHIVVGRTDTLPKLGDKFFMIAESTPGKYPLGLNVVETTPVESIEQINKEYQFSTKNSTYKLQILSVDTSGSDAIN